MVSTLLERLVKKHPLPQGLELKNSYRDLTPCSAKVKPFDRKYHQKEYNNSCQSHSVSTKSGQQNSKFVIAHK